MYELCSLLKQGLQASSHARTTLSLGDRSKYVGLSDIGKAADCLRTAVAGKVYLPQTLTTAIPYSHDTFLRTLRMQRGHWFENGITEAFHATGIPVLHQMGIHARHHQTPIIAHLDLVLVTGGNAPRVQVVEVKSCEHIPDTAYAAHEVQLSGQIGLLNALWSQPCFMVQPGQLRTFPDLVRHVCNIALPEQAENVAIEGTILMLSMNDVKVFGPYTPNKIMLDVCLNLAESIWQNAEQVRNGKLNLNQIPTTKGWHPLCDSCEWNVDCPRFDGLTAPEMEQDLLELQSLKDARDTAATRIREMEDKMKQIFRGIGTGRDWISAVTHRFRVGICEGRKTLDKDRLLTALAPYLSADESEAVIQAGYKTGEPYERLYVSPVNKSI